MTQESIMTMQVVMELTEPADSAKPWKIVTKTAFTDGMAGSHMLTWNFKLSEPFSVGGVEHICSRPETT